MGDLIDGKIILLPARAYDLQTSSLMRPVSNSPHESLLLHPVGICMDKNLAKDNRHLEEVPTHFS